MTELVKEKEVLNTSKAKKDPNNLYNVLDYLAENLGIGKVIKEAILERDETINQLMDTVVILQGAINDVLMVTPTDDEDEEDEEDE